MKAMMTAALLAAAMMGGASADDDHTNPFAAMGFLAGDWRDVTKGVTVEEHWVGPVGGIMAGMTITYSDAAGAKTKLESMSVEMRDGKIAFVARPEGQPETVFPHDFPQRVIYSISSTTGDDFDALDAKIEGTIDGKEQSMEWHYKKIAK
jgi:hypothetical protein